MVWYCSLVLLLAAFAAVRSECVNSDNHCSANCDGTTISIENVLTYPVTLQVGKYNFTFDPCQGTLCGFQREQTKDSAVCQIDPANGGTNMYSCGLITHANWTITSKNPLEFYIVYSGGDQASNTDRSSKVTFTTSNINNISYIAEDSASQYQFQVTAPAGSYAGNGDYAGPIGFVLIFLAIIAFIAYLVIGGVVMYFAKGARGIEVIPNITFWKDLPFLLKDAILLIISPCYKGSKYEKI